ncbi:MAG: nucleoside deaminase [Alphaproteobacteria bacterium]|nr:nucleoside deaminase [Alphaproteobacteria bacterium]
MNTFLKFVIETAINAAKQAMEFQEVPVAAVIFSAHDEKIISTAANRTERDHDPTAHAEILALRSAAALLRQTRLTDYDMYVTLEPCPMCATAISFARIKRLYFGAYDVKGGSVDHGCRLYQNAPNLYVPEVYGGIAQTQCEKLLTSFFQTLRGAD